MDSVRDFRDWLGNRMQLLPHSLKPSEWKVIEARIEPWSADKEVLLLEQGKICRYLYFLADGLLRYGTLNNGLDSTNYFTRPGQIFTGSQSFSEQRPSPEFIETILPSRGIRISYDQARELYAMVPAWNGLILAVLRQVNADIQALMQAGKQESPEARYRQMLEKDPELVRDVPIKYLAGYLGIAPESLSRIRRRMRN